MQYLKSSWRSIQKPAEARRLSLRIDEKDIVEASLTGNEFFIKLYDELKDARVVMLKGSMHGYQLVVGSDYDVKMMISPSLLNLHCHLRLYCQLASIEHYTKVHVIEFARRHLGFTPNDIFIMDESLRKSLKRRLKVEKAHHEYFKDTGVGTGSRGS